MYAIFNIWFYAEINQKVTQKVVLGIVLDLNATRDSMPPLVASINACKAQVHTSVDACKQCVLDMCTARY
jgi:hypothetical protein